MVQRHTAVVDLAKPYIIFTRHQRKNYAVTCLFIVVARTFPDAVKEPSHEKEYLLCMFSQYSSSCFSTSKIPFIISELWSRTYELAMSMFLNE